MPKGFAFPTNEELWIPLYSEFPPRPRRDPAAISPAVLGLLKDGVSLDQANAEATIIAKRFAAAYPDSKPSCRSSRRSYQPSAPRASTRWSRSARNSRTPAREMARVRLWPSWSLMREDWLSDRASAEAEVTCAQPLERRAIRSDHVRMERVCGRHQPCVVLAHPARCATLQEGAPSRLCEVQSLNRKSLQ